MDQTIAGASESAVEAARDLVVVFSRLGRRLREVAGDEDLTPSQTSVLSRLSKGGASTASALASVEGVRPQSMAAILTALDQHSFIERHPDPADGRRQVITLTAAGRERAEGNRQARQEWLVRAIDERLTKGEQRSVITAMALVEKLTSA